MAVEIIQSSQKYGTGLGSNSWPLYLQSDMYLQSDIYLQADTLTTALRDPVYYFSDKHVFSMENRVDPN